MSNPQEPYQPGHANAGVQPGQFGMPGGYSEGSPFGLPGQPPARDRKRLWTILGIAGGVVVLAIIGIVVLFTIFGSATNRARGLADGFTKLVIAGDYSKAYDDYLDPALQEQLPKEDFIEGVKGLNMDDTCKPAYNDFKVDSENGINAADIAGVITCDGQQVDLAYRFEGTDDLKMTNIKLRPKE
ncbi:MAG TPA: hypothetical protein VD841_10515 [Arthrobacter sp.]|nr:hypothetical protein [Arthrobacter sp.]